MVVDKVINWIVGVLVLGAISYVLSLRAKNQKLKHDALKREIDDEIQKTKDKAFNSSLDDLVAESNQEFRDGKRNK